MSKKYEKGIVVHTKDLRLFDNRTIKKAYEECSEVMHIFILYNTQLQSTKKVFDVNTNALEFMYNSLLDLQEQLKDKNSLLVVLKGDSFNTVLHDLRENFKFEALYISKDYSPHALSREDSIYQYCLNVSVHYSEVVEHILLDNISNYLKATDSKPYTVFTPFYKNALKFEVPLPLKYTTHSLIKSINLDTKILKKLEKQTQENLEYLHSLFTPNSNLLVKGGRSEAFEILKELDDFNYKLKRDYPSIKGTTRLSAHHKFGTISMRESYYSIKDTSKTYGDELLRELYWHDFYILIAKHFPHVFEHAFQQHYDDIKWINDTDDENFKAWCRGETGFPIIDAGMRELNTTGYMHNRVRMIVASFLTKDLHIHWLLGEAYFASKLTDYDSCVNNGSWQWAASTGCDAQPYFRIFNPWLQQERFDKNCDYIKKWIPELESLDVKVIHNLGEQRPLFFNSSYPKPIVNHKKQKNIAISMFKRE
ncbi:MAG: DNA photolyase family protein [Nanoarchaeota archaeon]|nr:DNA photolyase family protein [Nanoarchaeota archaeon]